MGVILKEYPIEELPREKAIEQGVSSLSNVELVAILLRTGNKQESAIELSQKILNQVGGMNGFKNINYHTLIQIKGIKKAKAVTLLAAIELAKRLLKTTATKPMLNNPTKIYHYIINEVIFQQQERVYVLCLNNRLEVVSSKLLFIGGSDFSMMSSNEIFQQVLVSGTKKFVLIHNHPSGNPSPSKEDISVTKKIDEMAKSLEITFIDHIIIGENSFYSFSGNQLFKNVD